MTWGTHWKEEANWTLLRRFGDGPTTHERKTEINEWKPEDAPRGYSTTETDGPIEDLK